MWAPNASGWLSGYGEKFDIFSIFRHLGTTNWYKGNMSPDQMSPDQMSPDRMSRDKMSPLLHRGQNVARQNDAALKMLRNTTLPCQKCRATFFELFKTST
jgi:hypothetical protein